MDTLKDSMQSRWEGGLLFVLEIKQVSIPFSMRVVLEGRLSQTAFSSGTNQLIRV